MFSVQFAYFYYLVANSCLGVANVWTLDVILAELRKKNKTFLLTNNIAG